MDKIMWYLLVLISGTLLPVQAGLNARLGRAAESPLYAALISFLVGSVALIIYILVTAQSISWNGLKNSPAYTWSGGIMGAFYVTVSILAFPRIGPAMTFGLIVLGQMIVSVLLDHFNILVMQPAPLNIWKFIGVLMIVGGVIIIRKF